MQKLNISYITNSSTTRRSLARFLAGALLASTIGCAAKPVIIQKPAAVVEQKKQTISDEEIAKMFEPVIRIWLSDRPLEERLESAYLEFGRIASSDVKLLDDAARFKFIAVTTKVADLVKILTIYNNNFKSTQAIEERIRELVKGMLRVAYQNNDMAKNLERLETDGNALTGSFTEKETKNIQYFVYIVNTLLERFRRNPRDIAELPDLKGENSYAQIINAFLVTYREINASKTIVGQRFPDVGILNGNPFAESGFISLTPPFEKPVIINMWGYFCPPCHYEMAGLEAIGETGAAIVIGLHVKMENGRDWRQTLGITVPPVSYQMGDMPPEVVEFLPIKLVPFTLILDQFGIIRYELIGPQEADDILKLVMDLNKIITL